MWAGGLVGALVPMGVSGRSPRKEDPESVKVSPSRFLASFSSSSLLSPPVIAMASFLQSRPVLSAVRKQSTAVPFGLQTSSQSMLSRSGTCSSFSSLCSSTRSTNSQNPRQSLSSTVPTQQSRTFLVQFRRQSQSLKENPPSKFPPADLQLTNLPYFIRRTPSNQLPVYLITKAGGTKQQTKLQKTEGDLDALRKDLAQFLGLESGDPAAPQSPDVAINRLTGHILVKGWRKPEIQQFLLQRNF
ncbi:hypothetical protein P170DRAFT_472760 [Aspergillus steynii IBT 23096]|uniref:Large ribosomal subunit protein mL49 n=1 Tax=Aspergillus steynii IBT 23096 TaxID=1392250 RepID=A0A2I2GJ11_9EURO|nr:uncharacterized protein P170DRAFT_472760 [Aspergillus steynii IBT 23096]PLB52870.1 hypothetical protein P170DRAFT_472760 [Aspergillus steynii IBT 23096]